MRKLLKLFTALALAVGVVLPIAAVNAQSSSLSVMPRVEMIVEKGTVQKGKLTVNNPDPDHTLELTLRVVDFTAKDQTGASQLDLSDNPKSEPWSIRDFIDLPSSVSVAAGSNKDIDFTISIPGNVGAGSYYSAVQYLAAREGEEKNVNITASAVTQIFVDVPGDTKEQLSLTQLGAFSGDVGSTDGSFKLFYFGSKPKLISYTLKNDGNVAERPQGAITLKNTFTGKIYRINDINPNDSTALRGQERRFDACIKQVEQTLKSATGETKVNVCEVPDLTPGRYTVTLNGFYGQTNNKSLEVVGVSSFWYLPWWIVISGVVAILLVVGLVWWIVNKVKNIGSNRR